MLQLLATLIWQIYRDRLSPASYVSVQQVANLGKQSLSVADPGFSRGGANSQNCYYFSHFCRKLHENERIWTPGGGGGRPWRIPLDPPMVMSFLDEKKKQNINIMRRTIQVDSHNDSHKNQSES